MVFSDTEIEQVISTATQVVGQSRAAELEAAFVRVLKDLGQGIRELQASGKELTKRMTEAEAVKLTKDDEAEEAAEAEEDKPKKAKGHGKGWRERTSLSKLKGADHLPKFTGSREGFPKFGKKVVNFLHEEPKLRDIMRDVVRRYKEVVIDDRRIKELASEYDDEEVSVAAYSAQLYSLLIGITDDTPFDLVDGTNGNGFEAWRKLHSEYAPESPEDKREQVQHITHPPVRAKNYQEILHAQTEWEKAVTRYGEMLRDGEPLLSDDVLITGYMAILPDVVAESIRNMKEDLDSLDEIKRYVRRQVVKHAKGTHKAKPALHVGEGREGDHEASDRAKDDHEEQDWEEDCAAAMGKGSWGRSA